MENKTGKVDAKELAKELLVDRRHGSARVEEEEMKKSQRFCEGYKAFLSAAKTERESVDFAVEAAEKAGFVPFDPHGKYAAGDKVYYNNRGKSICLAVIGKKGTKAGVRIVAAHIDNPRVDLDRKSTRLNSSHIH